MTGFEQPDALRLLSEYGYYHLLQSPSSLVLWRIVEFCFVEKRSTSFGRAVVHAGSEASTAAGGALISASDKGFSLNIDNAWRAPR